MNQIASISIIVVCKNEENLIGKCLQSLMNLRYPKDRLEIILVDGGSTDATCDIIHSFQRQCPYMKCIQVHHSNIAYSRNQGVYHATSDFIAFTDADCMVPYDWLTTLIEYWEKCHDADPMTVMVGGGNNLAQQEGLFRRALAVMLQSYLGSRGSLTGMRKYRAQRVEHIPTVNVLILRSILQKIPFDERCDRNGEDQVLSWQVKEQRYHAYYTPESSVLHFGPDTVKEWAYSMFIYGQYRMRLFTFYPQHFDLISTLPFILCILEIWSLILVCLGYAIGCALFLLYFSSMVLYTLFVSHKRGSLREKGVLLFLYILTHHAYGIGFAYEVCGRIIKSMKFLSFPKRRG